MNKRIFIRYTLAFVFIAVLGYFPFWVSGTSLVWHRDGMGQYYPTFLYIGQYIREFIVNCMQGHFRPFFFDLSIGMGEDVLGVLNYYGFGDPLNLFTVFATKENGVYIFTAMYFLRLYLAGMCFIKYSSYMGLGGTLSCAGALCYVFSGYAVIGGARYIQFLAPMIYLPLMLLGCEKIFRERKVLLLALTVAYAATCTFYFLYMASLFFGVYVIIRCLFIYGYRQIAMILKNMAYCISGYVLGILLAAPILLPSIDAFLNSYRSSISLQDILQEINNYIPNKEYFIEYIKGCHVEYTIEYWVGVPILQFICMFLSVFMLKKKRSRQCALAVVTGLFLWCIPMTRYVFSGFGNNYARYMFLMYFVYAVVFICCVDEIIMLIKKYDKAIRVGIFLIIILNIVVNLSKLYGERGENWHEEFISFNSAKDYVDSPVNYAAIAPEDIAVCRIATDTLTGINERPENVAMLNNYNGLTFWFSIVNENTQKMINQIGTIKRLDWRSYGLNDNSVLESMAGVKYYLQNDQNIKKIGYELVENVPFLNQQWKLYKNKNALPLAYTYEQSIAGDSYENLSVIEKMMVMLQYVAIESGEARKCKSQELDIMQKSDVLSRREDNVLYVNCNIESNKEVYLELPQNDLYKLLEGFKVAGEDEIYYKGSRNRDIVYNLGTIYSGEKLELSLQYDGLSEEEIDEILSQVIIWTLDERKYEELIGKRNNIKEKDIHILNDKILVDGIWGEGDEWLLLSVPYSKNWKCYIDGKETPIYLANTMYMAVEMEKGTHQITFIYKNEAFYVGVILCSIVCICYTVFRIIVKEKKV